MLFFPTVQQRAARIPDAVEKLRFLRRRQMRTRRRGLGMWVLWVPGFACLFLGFRGDVAPISAPVAASIPVAAPPVSTPEVWPVETGSRAAASGTVYSNGLSIRDDYRTTGADRRYRVFTRAGKVMEPAASLPAGIVFHTTESLILPLEPSLNHALRRSREEVLRHVQRDKLYNFVIDRFGQVYRIVPEDRTAHHAGHSVWAEAERVFVDLNESFIGISFEAETNATFTATPAQIHAGRLLTDWLRGRYGIGERNCVTHAQVSVNPDNLRIGYHTDWASRFPFREIGLETGYAAPIAAISVFGFVSDKSFLVAIGGEPWPGMRAAEEELARGAQSRKKDLASFRKSLQQQYRNLRRTVYERAE